MVIVNASTAYVRVNSPLSNSVISGSDAIVDAAVSTVYANVFGVSNQAQLTSNGAIPVTNAFNRPRAGLIVSAPGLADVDAAAAMPESASFSANSHRLLDDSFSNMCTANTVVIGDVDGSHARWNAKSAAFEVVGAGKSSETFAAMVSAAASPCSLGAQQLFSDALGASVVSSGDHCAITLPTGEVLSVSSLAASRVVSEVLLLLNAVSGDASSATSSCPALIEFSFGNLKALGADQEVASKLVSAAVAKASAIMSARYPSRHATALFTTQFHVSGARVLPAVSPSPIPWKQVASYQVALWVGVGLALALAAAVGSLLFMDLGRDPVLYNQFKNEDSKRD